MINYDELDYINPGKDKFGNISENILNDDSSLIEIVHRVEKVAQPIDWVIDLEIDNSPTVFAFPHIAKGCVNEYPPSSSPNYTLISTSCDRSPLVRFMLSEHKLSSSFVPEFRLDLNLLTNIERVNLTDIFKWSNDKIQRRFTNKTVLIGFFEEKLNNRVARDAIAFDEIFRANARRHPLPFLIYRSRGEQFGWIFFWSVLTGVALCKKQWQLLIPLIIISWIALLSLLLILGQLLPIVATTIASLVVSIIVIILKIGDKQHRPNAHKHR